MHLTIAHVLALATLALLVHVPATYASSLSYGDGVCGETIDYSFDCQRWDGPDGFTVTSDMPQWTFGGDRFFDGFLLKSEDNQTHMVFQRDRAFTLESLNVALGGFADDFDGCAQPMEVRSSNGGLLLLEPDAGTAGEMCWSYTANGFDLTAHPWAVTPDRTITFDGPEWSNLAWFYIGFTPAWSTHPYPRYSTFAVNSVSYVPEPSLLLLLATAGAVAARRAQGAAHRRPGLQVDEAA